MKRITCPNCHNGLIEQHVVRQYRTKVGGVDFTVENATITKCSECDFIAVAAGEIRKWEEQLRSMFQEQGLLPTPERIQAVLQHFGLTRADLANMLCVTRQTIQGWMKDPILIPDGPGPIVVLLLEAESKGQVSGVYDKLAADARSRGRTMSVAHKPKIVLSNLRRNVPQGAKFFSDPEHKTAA
jgi:YgiT-type zinc finger domain-containing protein